MIETYKILTDKYDVAGISTKFKYGYDINN